MIHPHGPSTRWRRIAAALAVVLGIGLLSGCATAKARLTAAHAAAIKAPGLTSSERQVVDAVNGFRAAHGMRPLGVNQNLEEKARAWAAWMAAGNCGTAANGSPAICHSDLATGITVPWSRLEENVGEATPASNLPAVLNGLEHSPEHAANMLNGSITEMGAGVVVSGNTVLVAEEFMAPA
jgi:uncharacterized protein YkwD